ncbi:uncharacterized protein IL334_007653 [Kwoniella shivajii]|uniref:Bromo domain-containing protein n=1 Tax=Kwoniella shivajii TaxID=564305 RepID=A0ABZ1DBD3_9TREE|nr:hypothetical protein IL334_007653 [Kwoniella shivajii]
MSTRAAQASSLLSNKDASSSSRIKAEVTPKEDASPSLGESSSTDPNTSSARTRKRRLDVDTSLIISEERSKRRTTPNHENDHSQAHGNTQDQTNEDQHGKDPIKVKELGYILYGKMMDAKDSEGNKMCDPFIKLPNKRALPDYYETIKHPMSLEIVHAKLESNQYQSLKDVCSDLGQIFNNAKRYNVRESLIFQYAKKLHKMTRVYYSNIANPGKKDESDSEGEHDSRSLSRGITMQPTISAEGYDDDQDAEGEVDPEGEGEGEGDIEMGEPLSTNVDGTASGNENLTLAGLPRKRQRRKGAYMKDGPSVYKLIKPVLRAIKETRAKDGSGREITGIFLKLPERRDLPDYYKTIKDPISLEEIESKQLGRRYESFEEFVYDIDLMCKNAMEYNEDGSEVHRDAQQIKEVVARYRNAPKPRPSSVTPAPASGPAFGYMGNQMLGTRPSYPPFPTSFSQSPVFMPPSGPNPSAYSPGPSRLPPPVGHGTRPFLPALPPGVVTEEVVASLNRYPPYEQQAWAQSLPPLAMNIYRSMLATNEARKRSLPPTPQHQPQSHHHYPPQILPQAQSQSQSYAQRSQPQPNSTSGPQRPPVIHQHSSTPRPDLNSRQSYGNPPAPIPTSTPTPVPRPERPKPPIPTIKYLDFGFNPASTKSLSREILRLNNFRGVVTHSIILNSTTSEIELTAYIADQSSSSSPVPSSSANPAQSIGTEDNASNGNSTIVAQPVTTPELSLRVNGNQGSLPKFIFSNGSEDGIQGERPKAMRWTIHVSTSRIESKIEVIATKPGALAETTTIFVSRQY